MEHTYILVPYLGPGKFKKIGEVAYRLCAIFVLLFEICYPSYCPGKPQKSHEMTNSKDGHNSIPISPTALIRFPDRFKLLLDCE